MCFRPPEMNRRIKRCPSCQTVNPPALNKCKKCGADLPKEADLVTGTPGAAPGAAIPGVPAPGVAAPGVAAKDKDPEPGT
jgi:hypothetical protein